MKPKVTDLVKFVVGWPLSLLALFFLIRLILPNLTQVQSSLSDLNFLFLGLSILCFLGYYLLRGLLWHSLMRTTGVHIPLKETVYLWSISEINRYIPGNVWSFLSRSMKFNEKKIAKKDIAASLLQETLFILAGALIIALVALPFLRSIEAFAVFIAAVPDLFLDVIVVGSVLLLILQGVIFWRIKYLQRIFANLNYSARKTAVFFLFSLMGLSFFGFGYYFAISAVAPLPASSFFNISAFAVVSLLVGYLSFITPAGLGVREGFLTVGLANFMTVPLAGFAALFARVILILSEIIFLALAKAWTTHTVPFLLNFETRLKADPPKVILVLCTIFYAIYFSAASMARYANFNTGRFDLGNMVQTVWNTSQGRIFVLTDPNGTETISRLAFHSDFILVFFAPIYALIPHPNVLLITQAVVVALGGLFLYGIARILLKNNWAALLVSLAYLLNPSLQRANLYDFHAVVLATTFFLASWYFYLKKRYIVLVVFLFLAAITKEQIWAVTAIFGLYMCVTELINRLRKKNLHSVIKAKRFIYGILIFLVSLVMLYLILWQFIPMARGGQHFALEFYGEFGTSPSELVTSILTRPLDVLQTVTAPDRIEYFKKLLLPLGFLPLLSPLVLVFILPDLAVNLLSSNPNFLQIYYQYTAVITPFLFIAAVYALRFLNKVLPKVNIIYLSSYLLIAAIYGAYLYGPLPGGKNPNLQMFDEVTLNREEIAQFLQTIPKSASVAATNNAGSHLSEREQLTTIPLGINDAEYVVFLTTQDNDEHNESIIRFLNNPNYILLKNLNNFYVFYRINYLTYF